MEYVILSAVKGYSKVTYPTPEVALEVARAAWKQDPDGIGMCSAHEVTCQYDGICLECMEKINA